MPQSLTRDWEYKVFGIAEHIIIKIIIPHPLLKYQDDGDGDVEAVEDDGELASAIEQFFCDFIEEIENCSSFEADKQLKEVLHKLGIKE